MAESNKPLVAVITRLVPQKGIPLIKAALYRWGVRGVGRGEGGGGQRQDASRLRCTGGEGGEGAGAG